MTDEGGFLPLAYSLSKLIPVRNDFSRADKATIKKYGNLPINKLTVVREPINKYVSKALNVITLGAWQKAVATYGYDNIYHLYLLIDLVSPSGGGKITTLVLEKNETPRCYLQPKGKRQPNTESIPVEIQAKSTLFTFLQKGIASMGNSFWVYSSFQNNCQDFLIRVLSANDVLTPNVATFIKQNSQAILSHLPSYTKNIADTLTDTARRLRTLVGLGLPVGLNKH